MKTFIYSLLLVLPLFTNTYAADVDDHKTTTLSASSDEISYTYDVSFRTLIKGSANTLDRVDIIAEGTWHASHLFGLFQSSDYVVRFGIPQDLVEGFAGTKDPTVTDGIAFNKKGDENIWVTYRAESRMLVMKPIVKTWLGDAIQGTIQLPMLIDMPKLYVSEDRDAIEEYADSNFLRCTDEHYQSPSDFSYFYNPYRCPELATTPIGEMVNLHLHKRSSADVADTKVPIADLRSDNGNGKLVTLYFINGFYENPSRGDGPKVIHRDDGWKLYAGLDKVLTAKKGKFQFTKMPPKVAAAKFKKEMEKVGPEGLALYQKIREIGNPIDETDDNNRTYFSTYVKKVGDLTYVIRMNLANTENAETGKPLKTFPKFWKEAWENGDFVYYGGHSGDGVSMNPEVMQNNLDSIFNGESHPNPKVVTTAGKKKKKKGNLRLSSKKTLDDGTIQFQKNKTQVMLFDACSSYAHYQDAYREKNPKLHLMTWGLVSLFHLAQVTAETLIDLVVNQPHGVTWLTEMETIQRNQLKPAIKFMWGMTEGEVLEDEDYKKYLANKQYPDLLLSVSVPE